MLLDYITAMGRDYILLPGTPPAHGERVSDPFIKKQDHTEIHRTVCGFLDWPSHTGLVHLRFKLYLQYDRKIFLQYILEKIFLSLDSWPNCTRKLSSIPDALNHINYCPRNIMLPLSTFIAVICFVFGACIGSFLNVVIYRMPEGQSIVSPPSHCPACTHVIPFYFNLPIISFLLLKGKCRFCKAPISIRYPLVELITGLLALGLFFKFGLTPTAVFYFAFGCLLIAISFIDLDHQIIPDKLSLPGIIIFSTSCFFVPQMRFVSVIWGVLTGGGILYLVALLYYCIRKHQGMGGGDIKLLAMIGAATGVKGVFFTLFTGSVFGTLGGVAAMSISGKSEKRQAKIPFGPFLSLGAMLYIFWGEPIIRWYINFQK